MADDHDFVGVELGPTGPNGPIVAESLVAVQFDEFVEHQFEIVGCHGAIGVPGNLDRLPGLQLAVDPLLHVGQLAPQAANLVAGFRLLHCKCFQFLIRASNS